MPDLFSWISSQPDALVFTHDLDFGDALHLALSAKAEELLTFDRSLAKLAGKIGAAPEVTEAP